MFARALLASLFVSSGFVVGCSSEADPAPSETRESDDATEPSDPEANRRSGTSDGAGDDDAPRRPVAQSAACVAYLACVAEATPEAYDAALAVYGPEGSCWSSDTPESCTMACEIARADAEKTFPESPSCSPSADDASKG
ncbi:MAG: hypothetical protein KF764_03480 [Labilithrix sp.]|nr:hypothetical protein [Labilithrix sp.]